MNVCNVVFMLSVADGGYIVFNHLYPYIYPIILYICVLFMLVMFRMCDFCGFNWPKCPLMASNHSERWPDSPQQAITGRPQKLSSRGFDILQLKLNYGRLVLIMFLPGLWSDSSQSLTGRMAGWLFAALLPWPCLIRGSIWGRHEREAAPVVQLRTQSELSV